MQLTQALFESYRQILAGLALACMTLLAPAAQAIDSKPLSKSEFDAIVSEAITRKVDDDNHIRSAPDDHSAVYAPWQSLTPEKLARLMEMPEFAHLDDNKFDSAYGTIKSRFIDQAGAWNLLHFRRPSDIQKLFARWYPELKIDQPAPQGHRTRTS